MDQGNWIKRKKTLFNKQHGPNLFSVTLTIKHIQELLQNMQSTKLT